MLKRKIRIPKEFASPQRASSSPWLEVWHPIQHLNPLDSPIPLGLRPHAQGTVLDADGVDPSNAEASALGIPQSAKPFAHTPAWHIPENKFRL
jgi:hypothetical protein